MVNRTKFAALVTARRKARGLTQRQLAEQLHVSDKAVSKWERALSLPDIELLEPLAAALGLTVTELLRGEALPPETTLPLGEVESLVSDSIGFGRLEQARRDTAARRRYLLRWVPCTLLILAEIAVVALVRGMPPQQYLATMAGGPMLAVGMGVFFSLAVVLGFPERLPDYYDENRIYGFSNGFLRMNLPIRLHNRNWPAIKAAMFWGCLGMAAAVPLADLAAWYLAPPQFYQTTWPFVILFLILGGIFLPVILAGLLADHRSK